MKKFISIIVLLGISAALWFLWQSEQDEKITKIQSDIEGVILEVPEAALPEGTSSDDISVASIDPAEIDIGSEDGEVFAYHLQPDGLKFKEQVFLSMPFEDDRMPVFLHVYDDQVDLMAGVEYIYAKDNNTARVPVDHFSSIVGYLAIEGSDRPFRVEGDTQDSYIGEPVNSSATVTLERKEWTDVVRGEELFTFVMEEGTQTLSNDLLGRNVKPVSIENAPPPSTFGDSYTIRPTGIQCHKKGPAILWYNIEIRFDVSNTNLAAQGVNVVTGRDMNKWVRATVETHFDCLERPPGPPEPKCGDEKADPNEACDTNDFKEKTCKDYGFGGGYLACDKECQIITSYCRNVPTLGCSENTWDDRTGEFDIWQCVHDCPEGQYCDPLICACKDLDEATQDEIEQGTPEETTPDTEDKFIQGQDPSELMTPKDDDHIIGEQDLEEIISGDDEVVEGAEKEKEKVDEAVEVDDAYCLSHYLFTKQYCEAVMCTGARTKCLEHEEVPGCFYCYNY